MPPRSHRARTVARPCWRISAAVVFSVGLLLAGRARRGRGPAGLGHGRRRARSGCCSSSLPLLVTRRFRLTRPALPLVVAAGVLEVFGGAIYVVAASESVAVAAVLSSQFAAIAALGGFFLFGERLQRLQLVGVATVAVGVTLLAATQG